MHMPIASLSRRLESRGIESWPVPVNASAMGEAAFAEWCAQVRARAPKF